MSDKFKFHGGADLFRQKLSAMEGGFFDNKGNIWCQFKNSNGAIVSSIFG